MIALHSAGSPFGFFAVIYGLVILTIVLADATTPSEDTAMRWIVDGEKRRWRALFNTFRASLPWSSRGPTTQSTVGVGLPFSGSRQGKGKVACRDASSTA